MKNAYLYLLKIWTYFLLVYHFIFFGYLIYAWFNLTDAVMGFEGLENIGGLFFNPLAIIIASLWSFTSVWILIKHLRFTKDWMSLKSRQNLLGISVYAGFLLIFKLFFLVDWLISIIF